jgi:hypothetical protein
MEPRMRRVAKAMILPLLIPLAAANAAPQTTVLAPGKPAGIKQAQDQDTSAPLLVMGAAAVGIGIALAVSNNNDNVVPPATSSTTTTGTAP